MVENVTQRSVAYWEGIAKGRAPEIADAQLSDAPAFVQRTVARLLREGVFARIGESRIPFAFDDVLDAGCGLGDWALAFAPFSRAVLAFDVGPAFVSAAARAAEQSRRTEVTFRLGRIEDLRQIAGIRRFDMMLFSSVFQHVDDSVLADVLGEARPLLCERGLVYVRASVSNRCYERRLHGEFSAIYRRPERYEEFFGSAGFTVLGRWPSEQLLIEAMGRRLPGALGRLTLAGRMPFVRLASAIQRLLDPVGFMNWLLTPTS